MFRFSIRDLLLVTVIVALVMGWWVDHRFQIAAVKDNAAAAAANFRAAEQWQQISENAEQNHETILRSLGFGIEKDGSTTTITLAPTVARTLARTKSQERRPIWKDKRGRIFLIGWDFIGWEICSRKKPIRLLLLTRSQFLPRSSQQ